MPWYGWAFAYLATGLLLDLTMSPIAKPRTRVMPMALWPLILAVALYMAVARLVGD